MLRSNCPNAYVVPDTTFEAILEHLDDVDLAHLARNRQDETSTKVNLNDL